MKKRTLTEAEYAAMHAKRLPSGPDIPKTAPGREYRGDGPYGYGKQERDDTGPAGRPAGDRASKPAKSLKSRLRKPQTPRISESAHQQAVIQWWASYCRTVGLDERLLMASQSGAVLSGDARARAIQAARLKREGWRAGVPDLQLAVPLFDPDRRACLFHGLWIELKTVGGRASLPQLAYIDLLRHTGYNALICLGADEAIRAITAYVRRARG